MPQGIISSADKLLKPKSFEMFMNARVRYFVWNFEGYTCNSIQNIMLIQNSSIFIQENAFEYVVCKMLANLFRALMCQQNGCHFADDIFKHMFINENVWIPIKISLKFVPKGPINNIPALVQIMAWRRAGNKPLSEPMMVSLPTHICVTQPQWVKVCCLQLVTILSKECFMCIHNEIITWKCISCYKPFWWNPLTTSEFSSERDNHAQLWLIISLKMLVNKQSSFWRFDMP